VPIIYAPEELSTVAYRFRTEINENAKQFAMSHFLPEQNHNEISARLGFGRNGCEIFLLRHENEGKRIAKRFEILKSIMGPHFGITEVHLKAGTCSQSPFTPCSLRPWHHITWHC